LALAWLAQGPETVPQRVPAPVLPRASALKPVSVQALAPFQQAPPRALVPVPLSRQALPPQPPAARWARWNV
jgi:hypothetical protein